MIPGVTHLGLSLVWEEFVDNLFDLLLNYEFNFSPLSCTFSIEELSQLVQNYVKIIGSLWVFCPPLY